MDVEFIDDFRGDDVCVKVVVEIVFDEMIVVGVFDGDLYVIFKLLSNLFEI